MSPAAHAFGIVVTAMLCVATERRCRGAWAPGVAILAVLPLVGLAIGPERTGLLFGTECLVEAITEGGLLALFLAAVRRRGGWVAAAALLLLLEELDYGQVLLGFGTPDWHGSLPTRSGRLNFHNLRGLDWAWQPLPIVAVALLSTSHAAVERVAVRFQLPRFHPRVRIGLVVALAAALVTAGTLGARAGNEVFELGLVAVVWAAWARGTPGATRNVAAVAR
ncbi:MAG: hypothetical protein Q8P41_27560 [Pseudomonadota bacterium]|nr:hypothetical protein [Pseudomonadota bacterium]